MCKDNIIAISWSWVGVLVCTPIIGGGIIASLLGAHLTWGEIMILPFILTFFMNKKHHYCFTDSGFTVQWMIRKHTVLAEEIKQINVFGTKSGTWIIVEIDGAPDISSIASRKSIISYCLRNRRKSFLIPLQWGERDKALEMLRSYYPQKIVIAA